MEMNTNTPCKHCGKRYHGYDSFAGQHPYEPSQTPDTYTPPEQTYTSDKLPTAAEMLQAANESSAVQQKVIDEYDELDTILLTFGAQYHVAKSGNDGWNGKDELATARTQILQYIEEQEAKYDTGLRAWIEYNKHDMGEMGEFIRTNYVYNGIAQQRQKLRGENKENNHV